MNRGLGQVKAVVGAGVAAVPDFRKLFERCDEIVAEASAQNEVIMIIAFNLIDGGPEAVEYRYGLEPRVLV